MYKQKIVGIVLIVFILTGIMTLDVKADTITVDDSKVGTTDQNSRFVTNEGTIMINNINSYQKDDYYLLDTFRAYKILDVYYNNNSNTITYEFTSDFKSFLATTKDYKNLTVKEYSKLSSGDTESTSVQSTSEIDKLASLYATYIKKNNINGIDMESANGKAIATAQAGSYLILPVVTMSVYSVMVGNIEFKGSTRTWDLYDARINAKKANEPIIRKSPIEPVEIGEEFNYYIYIGILKYPTNATNKTYILKDVADEGITFSGLSSMRIYDGETELEVLSDGKVVDEQGNEIGTVSIKGQEITININTDNITTNILKISYGARLNDKAITGTGSSDRLSGKNKNTATLIYSNDPYGTSTNMITKECGVATFGLEVFKYENNNRNKPLSGAAFDIYSDKECTKKVGTTTETNDKGIAYYKGLAIDTEYNEEEDINGLRHFTYHKKYYLKEIKAPSGYSLSNEVVIAKIGYDYVSAETDCDYDKVQPNGGGTTIGELPGYYRVEVSNNKMGLLPVTGAQGTIIITIMGLALVIGTTYYYLSYKREKKIRD